MKIKKITKIDRNQEDVYNLTVQDNHNYFVNETLVSNCHNSENEIINFMTLSLAKEEFHQYEIKNLLDFPDENLSEKEKYEWLFNDFREAVTEQYVVDESEIEMVTPNTYEYDFYKKRLKFLDSIKDGINMAENYNHDFKNGITIQKGKLELTFKPIYATQYGKPFLLDYGEKVLAMSATIFDKHQFCKDLGFDVKDAIFISCDSPIPPEKRPIHNMNVVNLNYKNKEENKPILLEVIKDLLEYHENERGIIHTVNYDIAKYLISNINNDRLIMPRGKERNEQIDYFMTSKRDDLVLISPSLTEGISLDDNLSRFTIVCKLPYGNLGDPWIKTRMERDARWYENETIQSLIQMTGRSVRSVDDFATGYILDQSFNWFYNKTETRFPKWWRTSLMES